VACTTLDPGQIQAGRGGRLMELGVHAGKCSALPCGRAAPPPPRGTGLSGCKESDQRGNNR
jgi:hypothetical protein